MSIHAPIVIVGAGHAGATLARDLALHGISPVVLIGDEAQVPYERPSLSKNFLSHADAVPINVWSSTPQIPLGIEWRNQSRVTRVNRAAKTIQVISLSSDLSSDSESKEEVIAYRYLVLATGGRSRQLNLSEMASGINKLTQQKIHSLRSVADAQAIRHSMRVGQKWLIIGAGFIGLEVAATLTIFGVSVTVLESGNRVLGRVPNLKLTQAVAQIHQQKGVKLVCDMNLEDLSWNAETNSFRVRYCDTKKLLQHGDKQVSQIEFFDHVLVGIGIQANSELAKDAALEMQQNFIVVDPYLCSSDPNIFAIGDVTSFVDENQAAVTHRETWHNAKTQAEFLAQHLSVLMQKGVKEKPYEVIPWFWSDQFEYSIQVMGYPNQATQKYSRIDVNMADTTVLNVNSFIDFGVTEDRRVVSVETLTTPSQGRDAKLAMRVLEKSLIQGACFTPEELQSAPLKNLLREKS